MTTTVPEAVVYIQLQLPSVVPAGVSLNEEIDNTISLAIQGEAVEVSEEYPTSILMAAFDVVHKLSPEMVLRLKSGKRVLLFNHQSVPTLMDKDIFVIHGIKEHDKTTGFTTELTINLENIWQKLGAKENSLESITEALNIIEPLIKPSMVTTLVGSAPVLLFLFVQHMLYGQTGEIWYQENLASTPIRITRI